MAEDRLVFSPHTTVRMGRMYYDYLAADHMLLAGIMLYSFLTEVNFIENKGNYFK